MNKTPGKYIAAIAVLALAGCAVGPIHDAALDDARNYVYSVRSDPNVALYAPMEIDQATATIRRADDLAARGGDLNQIHNLAAQARERAALAQQTTRMRVAEVAAQADRQRIEVAARAREADAAQRVASDAQMQADARRQQAVVAQQQATAAQRQADNAQQQVAAVQQQPQPLVVERGYGLRGMREQFPDLNPAMIDRGLVVTLNDIDFDAGSARLQPAGQQAVSRLAQYLTAHPELVISVEGFTDNAGNAYRNEQLSERRALAVQSALGSYGVDARRIVVRGYGPAYPIAGNDTPRGRQLNSRVEIVISDRGYVIPRA